MFRDIRSVPTGSVSAISDDQHCRGTLSLLGGFELRVDGELIQVSVTGQRLIAAVICRPRLTARSQLAHLLWPDTTSERAHANLRTAVYRMQRSGTALLEATSSYVRLTADIRIDFDQTSRVVTQVLASVGPIPPVLVREALQVNLFDDLLPDWDEEWLFEHQSRYRHLRLTTLEMLSRHLATTGQHGAAVHTALAAVHADSLRDSAHQTLIRACLAQGNRHEALTHFATYQRIFRDELGVEPAETIGQLLRSAV
jgi:DNA-binding SARP family transcriptional activator